MSALRRFLPLSVLTKPRVVTAALGLLLGGWAVSGALRPVSDPDVWWIAAAGRVVRDTGHVPVENGFSFTEPARAWVMHEWAYAPLYELGLRRVGPAFFSLFAVASGLLVAALVSLAILGRARTLAAGALATLVAFLPLALVFYGPRPSLVSLWLPVAVAMLALRRWTPAAALGCVALEWAWTQLHGSFPLGLGVLGLAAVAENDARARRVGTLALAALVTLANPYGLALHALVLGYGAGTSPAMQALREHVVEFRPIWEAAGTSWLDARAMLALAIVTGLAASALARRRDVPRALFVLGLVAMAAMQVRHWALAALLGAVLLAPEFERLVPEVGERPHETSGARARVVRWAVVPAAAAGLVAWIGAYASRPPDAWVAPSLGAGSVARLVRQLPDGARVWAPFDASAVAIWEGASRGVRVFFDPRNDCYGPETWAAFLRVAGGGPGALDELARRGTTHAIVPASTHMFEAAHWTRERADGTWVLYRRTGD